jgi:hypothetical protein
MPTYKNETDTVIVSNGIRILPDQIVPVKHFLSHASLTLLSDDPFPNPLSNEHDLSFSGLSDDQEVIINTRTRKVRFLRVTGARINVYRNSELNTPPMSIYAGETFEQEVNSSGNTDTSKFICVPTDVATMTIQELAE